MKSRLLVVFSVFALAGAAPAADSQLLKLVMSDAKVVSGIDVDRVKATAFGQFVLSQLPAGDAGLNDLLAATGFDPRRDIHEIMMASPADPQIMVDLKRRKLIRPSARIFLSDRERQIDPLRLALLAGGLLLRGSRWAEAQSDT